MFNDISKLKKFYSQRLGRYCAKSINNQLIEFLTNSKNLKILGVGYTFPFLKNHISQINSILFFMPHEYKGYIQNISSLVDINNLPIQDLYFDRIIVAHTLEYSQNIEKFLYEIWRILNGEGEALFIIPNRIGFWARDENNPFGHGQPYSKTQLLNLLRDNNFEIKRVKYALYAPPTHNSFILKHFNRIEKFFKSWLLGFGGVIIVEAKKQIYGIQNAKSLQKRKLSKLISIPSRAMRISNKSLNL